VIIEWPVVAGGWGGARGNGGEGGAEGMGAVPDGVGEDGDAEESGAWTVVDAVVGDGAPSERAGRARRGRRGSAASRIGMSSSSGAEAVPGVGVLVAMSRKGKTASLKTTCLDVMTRPVVMS
jgi:hypothetical protein